MKSKKIDYDFIWQEDENNLFYSLLIVNARIRKCAYSNDIVMIDDTVCTNQFGYPFINFIVFDENNMVQNLAVAIITSKEENNFVNIFQNLKEIIPEIRVFVIDRLRSQINALQKVYPQAYLVYCRIHIYRNIKNKMGSNKEILNLFWNFVEIIITEIEYINKLKKAIENSAHLRNLLNDIEHYNPYILRKLRMRGHYSTNAIEGSFGNLKKWTDHKILPLQNILKMFVSQSRIAIKNHCKIKYEDLDPHIYRGKRLGKYASIKIGKRYQKCLRLMAYLSHKDEKIAADAVNYMQLCNCNGEKDLPYVHQLYERISTFQKEQPLVTEEDIPDVFFFNPSEYVIPSIEKTTTIKSKQTEDWSFCSTMNKVGYFADLAQRSELVRKIFREFYKKAEDLKRTIDPMAKNIIVTPGAQPTVPSTIVNKFNFPKKRTLK